MDRWSWPWKKKSSEKTLTSSAIDASSACFARNIVDKDKTKNASNIKMSEESSTRLTELEGQVKILNEKLLLAQSETVVKENLVKQHAKVAEEAVSGWEKAELEASSLKSQLDSITLLKVNAEDRASHLNGALKECMGQIQDLKEEHHQKLHDIISTKTKHLENVKFDFEARIADLEQELLKSYTENNAILSSLEESSNMLMRITEEKSQADSEIMFLKTSIQACEKEISSLKYELHMVSKELEIRNEEKNISLRSAEAVNKQHFESVKKITKLEAECQRLRGLVRKKLPGPAALAQMKHEVANFGWEYGETTARRSPKKTSRQHQVVAPDYSIGSTQNFQRETKFLTARLLEMEEETKMLKEALSNRNSELQASRNLCAETARKLRSVEAHLQFLSETERPFRLKLGIPSENSLPQNARNPLSLTSMSENVIHKVGSESLVLENISELNHSKKDKNFDIGVKNCNPLELMDEFLEMEKLAHLSVNSQKSIYVSSSVNEKRQEETEPGTLVDKVNSGGQQTEKKSDLATSIGNLCAIGLESDSKQEMCKLKSEIALIDEVQAKESDMGKMITKIKCAVKNVEDALIQHSIIFNCMETSVECSSQNENAAHEVGKPTDCAISPVDDSKLHLNDKRLIESELALAVYNVHDFVISFSRELKQRFPDDHELLEKIEELSVTYDEILCGQSSIVNYVIGLSVVFASAKKSDFSMLTERGNEGECYVSDCIDKEALLEKKAVQHDLLKERLSSEYSLVSQTNSNSENLPEGSLCPDFQPNFASFKCSKEEFDKLQVEKDSMEMDLARCKVFLEDTRLQLMEMEQLVADLRSQLTTCQKSNSLAETQLKCMAESYKSLENRFQELEMEKNLVSTKAEILDNELQEEKRSHRDALAKCKDLEEKILWMEKCMGSISASAGTGYNAKQEREIAAAAEKLAVCQETVHVLDRQLKALRASSMDHACTTYNSERHHVNGDFLDRSTSTLKSPSILNSQDVHGSQEFNRSEMINVTTSKHEDGGQSASMSCHKPLSPSETESSISSSPNSSKRLKQKSVKLNSSSPSSTPEKHQYGLTRLFLRGKSVH